MWKFILGNPFLYYIKKKMGTHFGQMASEQIVLRSEEIAALSSSFFVLFFFFFSYVAKAIEVAQESPRERKECWGGKVKNHHTKYEKRSKCHWERNGRTRKGETMGNIPLSFKVETSNSIKCSKKASNRKSEKAIDLGDKQFIYIFEHEFSSSNICYLLQS